MQFTVDKKSALDAVKTASLVVSSKSPVPVLAGLLIKARKNGVSVTGTNLETWIRQNIPAVEVAQCGATVIPARKLAGVLRRLSGEVKVNAQGEKVLLAYQGGELHLQGYGPEEFPPFGGGGEAVTEEAFEFELGAVDFQEALKAVVYASGRDDYRAAFRGVQFEASDGVLTLVATDGHRLATCKRTITASGPATGLVPADALQKLLRILGQFKGKESVHVNLGTSKVFFTVGNVTLFTRLIETEFPNWRTVIPQGRQTVIRGEGAQITSALERAKQVFTQREIPRVILRVAGGTFTVRALQEKDVLEEKVNLEATGDDIEIAFDATYLLEALRAVSRGSVEVLLNGKNHPALIQEREDSNCLGVVMPVRVE